MLVGALALSAGMVMVHADASGTRWVGKVYVYNADQTVQIKSFSAGANGIIKTFDAKEECETFFAKDPDIAEALNELRTFVKDKVDPTFVIVHMCEAIAPGTEKI
jgi:hypothetical protein